MLKCSLGVIPFYLRDVAKFNDQVLCQLTYISWVVPLFRLDGSYLLFEGHCVIRQDATCNIQRMVSNQHCVQSYACCIDVYLLPILLALNLLRCHVESSSNFFFVYILDSHSLFGREPKINDLQMFIAFHTLWSKLEVFRLDVSVNIVHLVNVTKSIEKAFHNLSCLFFAVE